MAKPVPSHAEPRRRPSRCRFPSSRKSSPRPAGMPVYLVGGAVRDLLLGRGRGDLDLVVEGDAAALAAAAGRRGASSTSASPPRRSQLDGARGRHRHAPAPRPIRAPGALPRGRARAAIEEDLARRDFTINAMAIPLDAASARLIDPHGGLRRPRERAAAGPAPGLLRATTRPGRSAPPATPPASASSSSRRPRSCCATPTSARSRRDRRERRAAAARGRTGRAPAGFELLADWGLLELRPGGAELARAGRASCSRSRPGASSRRPRAGACSRPRSARRAASGSWRRRGRRGPRRRSRWPRGARPGRAGCSPGRWAPSGSTTTCATGARWSSRSAART